MKCNLLIIYIIFTKIDLSVTQQNFFYSSDGGYSNTCATQVCQICPTVGQYRQNCGANSHSDPGNCVACTNLPTGGQWISHGYFNNSCNFNCTEGYIKNNSICYLLMSAVSLKLQTTLTTETDAPFNRTAYIFALAKVSGCGTCTQWEIDPAVCGYCRIYIDNVTKLTLPKRRLLATSYVVGSTLVMIIPSTEVPKTIEPAKVSNLTDAISTSLGTELKTSAPVTTTTTSVSVAESTPIIPPPPPTTSSIPTTTTPSATSTTKTQSPMTTTTQTIQTTTPAPLISTTNTPQTTTQVVITPKTTTQVVITPQTTTQVVITPQTTTQVVITPQTTAAPPPPAEASSSNMALIGGAAGGGVFLIALIALVVVLLTRQGQKKPKLEPPAKPTAQAADSGLMYHRDDGTLALRVRVLPPVYRIY